MHPILWFITFLLIIAIVMFTPLNSYVLKYLYRNERVTPSSSTAQNNVRIRNEYNGVIYLPLYIEPVGDDEFNLRVESTEAPYRETVLRIIPKQLKHDPIEVLKSGFINYRLIRREMINFNYGIDDEATCDPTLTKDELQKVSASQFKEITELKGELMNEKATKDEYISDVIEHTTSLSKSKYQGGN